MAEIPRHEFVPEGLRHSSYDDFPPADWLWAGNISTLYRALMTDMLDLQGDEGVLEVGVGSGYQGLLHDEAPLVLFWLLLRPPICLRCYWGS